MNGNEKDILKTCSSSQLFFCQKVSEFTVAVKCGKWYDWFSVSSTEGKKNHQSYKNMLLFKSFYHYFEDQMGFGNMTLVSVSIKAF